jgi:hypothetical protein
MKTLKQLKQESAQFYTENAATYFAVSFNKKMGGTQTITFEDNFIEEIKIDKREYYQGRGAKYNSASMHEHINVFISKAYFEEKVNYRAKSFFNRQKEEQLKKKELIQFCQKNGLNEKNYTEKSSCGIYFDRSKQKEVEAELNVDLSDFFAANGKTYFFAESRIGLVQFYHNNRQSYSFDFTTEERRNEFYANRESWVSAPYAYLVGQTNNQNLFVC